MSLEALIGKCRDSLCSVIAEEEERQVAPEEVQITLLGKDLPAVALSTSAIRKILGTPNIKMELHSTADSVS
jgi:hypothetical protein